MAKTFQSQAESLRSLAHKTRNLFDQQELTEAAAVFDKLEALRGSIMVGPTRGMTQEEHSDKTAEAVIELLRLPRAVVTA